MAHKKAGGSSNNGRDSKSKRLGIKCNHGQHVLPGNILVRQRGRRIKPGANVVLGRDYTLHAIIEGTVRYYTRDGRKHVTVEAVQEAA